MIIYIIIFLISAFFTYIAEKFLNNKNKKLFYIFALISIIVPAILAGLRANSVGTDIKVYILDDFKIAQKFNFTSFFNYSSREPAFLMIVYFCAKILNNFQFLLFFLQLIIDIFVFMSCYNNRKNAPMWLTYIAFLCIFYNKGLNIVRQTLALSIVLFAQVFIKEKKFIKYLITIIFACAFHITAIFALILYPINLLVSSKSKSIYKFLIILVTVSFFVFYTQILSAFVSMGLLKARYLYYIGSEKATFELTTSLFKFFIVFLLLIYRGKILKNDEFNNYLIYTLILDLVLWHLGTFYNYSQRLSFYLGYNVVYLIPQLSKNPQKKSRLLSYFIILVLLIGYSSIYYGVLKCDQTVPYKIFSIY